MFRIGGSAGTGITSGLDKPRKQYANGSEDRFMELVSELMEAGFTQQEAIEEARKRLSENKAMGGRIGYANGTQMPNFQVGGLPGFLTSFGLNLLSTPPRGNIFQTAAVAAQDPFRTLQAQQAAAMKTASDRAFAKELAKEEREFEEGQLEKKLATQRDIAGMKTDELSPDLLKKYDNNEIKAQREKDFYTSTYTNLVDQYGDKTVATTVFDSEDYQKKGALERYLKQNPQLARQVVYDVATGKAVRFVKNATTGKFEVVPADSADIDTTGDAQPAPEAPRSFDYLSEKQKEKLKEIQEGSDSEFGIGFYD